MDYPDPDEEYELMHADDFDAMHEIEEDFSPPPDSSKPKSKRSLDFEASSVNKKNKKTNKVEEKNTQETEGSSEVSDKANTSTSSDGCTPLELSKRTFAELFGDIEDLDDIENVNKKRKLEESSSDVAARQDELINKILSLRKKQQEFVHSSTSNSALPRNETISDFMTRRVPEWPFMSVSGRGNRRIYLRIRSEHFLDDQVYRIASCSRSGSLLSVSYSKMYAMAKQELEKMNNGREKKEESKPANSDVQKDLWVSRYKPRSYLELLSDEGTNRSLLQWLKLWNKAVFNTNFKLSKKENKDGGWKKLQALSDELDEHDRPLSKVALLCGPPGLGKTTLAHLIAIQAGYNVVEVNASDDRSPQVFRTQLEAATQMKAVMGEDRRPNCLILDEIDGAPLASIDVLVKFTMDKDVRKGKGKNKKAVGILRRPIICICNDVYVPALRPLRQIAFTLHFPPTSSARLAQRLVEICKFEGVKTDLGSMMALGEKTNNDIRAALSVLHCIRARGSKVTLSQIQNTNVGVKDMQQSLFSVWQKIFQIVKPKVNSIQEGFSKHEGAVKSSPSLKSDGSSHRYRMELIIQAVHGCGDYEKLTQGVFENFPTLDTKFISLSSLSLALKWFTFNDIVSKDIYSNQNFILYPYLQYGFVIWHFIFASFSWPKLVYPAVGYEVSQKVTRNKQQLDYCLQGMSPYVRPFIHRDMFLLEVIPYLLEVIVPNLRTLSTQLFSLKEKEELCHVVSVMIDYNLNYTQERTAEGSYNFNLDPNLEEVGRFPESKSNRSLGYAGRQLVSREIEVEKIKRAEAMLFKSGDSGDPTAEAPTPSQSSAPSTSLSTPPGKYKLPQVPSHLQKLTPKALKKKVEKNSRDFFGRMITKKASSDITTTNEIVKSDIWFHFKEGYNNAVRKTVYMKDLMKPNK